MRRRHRAGKRQRESLGGSCIENETKEVRQRRIRKGRQRGDTDREIERKRERENGCTLTRVQ
jgi:hypothetical protein